MSWRAHRCRRAFRRPRSMANITGTAASFPIRQCNSSSAASPRFTALVFQVDLWDANGEVPLDIPGASCGPWKSTAPAASIFRATNHQKDAQIPAAPSAGFWTNFPNIASDDPEIRLLAEEARRESRDHSVQAEVPGKNYETAGKIFEFSRPAMEEHWRRAMTIPRAALGEPGVSS